MKTFLSKLTIASLLAPLFSLFLATPAFAAIIHSETTATLNSDDIIDDDLYIAGETVIVNGTINGDLYAAGGTVTINATVNGDVLAAGGNITISSSTIADDVRAAGGNINITSTSIGDSLSLVGGQLSVSGDTQVGGGVNFGGGNILLNADIARGVTGGGGSITIDSQISKDVQVAGGTLALGPNTSVGGNLTYQTDEDASIDSAAIVAGETKRTLIDKETVKKFKKDAAKFNTGMNFGFKLWAFFASMLIGSLLIAAFPKSIASIADNAQTKFAASFFWGFIKILIVLPAFILLLLTLIGIPLAGILLILFFVELYIAKIFTSIALGRFALTKLSQKSSNAYLSLAIGLAAYYLLSKLPFLGFITTLAFVLTGMGALFIFKRDLIKSQRK